MLKCLGKILEMRGSAGRAKRPRTVDVLGQWELNFQKRRRPEASGRHR